MGLEMQLNSRNSIFLPVFSVGLARRILGSCFFVTVLLAFITPSFSDSYFLDLVYKFSSTAIADAGAMAQSSKHPLALAVTYSSAIVLSFFSSVIIAFSRIDMSGFDELRKKGKLYRVAAFLFALLVVVLPVFKVLPVSELHLSYGFFQAVSESRVFLAFFGGGYLSLSVILWVWVFFELSNFVRSVK